MNEKYVEQIKIVNKLQQLTKEKGFIYSLGLMLAQDLIYDADQVADIDWRSKLNFQEISFLVGLMVKSPFSCELIDEEIVKFQIERTCQYLKELHHSYNRPLIDRIRPDVRAKSFEDIFGSGNSMAEAIFYGESGAYDFQLWELAIKRYQGDKEWILNKKGFQIENAVKVCKALKDLVSIKATPSMRPETYFQFLEMVLSIFCFTEQDINSVCPDEVQNILKAFSVRQGDSVNGQLTLPGQYNIINSNPIIALQDGKYFVPVLFNLAQSIYESPFYWMTLDEKYHATSLNNRGQATVTMASDYLKEVFGKDNVYEQVIVQKAKGHTLTDIDLLALTGNKAIVLQLKSKKLTALSRVGDEERLRADFKAAIQESYEQAKIARDAILKGHGKLIASNGHEVHLEDSIEDVYILCVTGDFYPAVTFQAESYLKKDSADPHPLTLSVFDLEILAFYFHDPFEFLYYLKQRISLHGTFVGQSEMDLVAYHLNQKIYPLRDEESGQPIDKALINGMGQLVDAHYPSARGYAPKTKAMERLHTKWANPEFQSIIEDFKRAKHPGFTDAIFFLYDMTGRGADKFLDKIRAVKKKCQEEGKSLRVSALSSDKRTGISYICDYGDKGGLIQNTEVYCKIKKYQMKADMWLGIGSVVNSTRIFDFAMFSKEPWVKDEEMEPIARSFFSKPKSIIGGKKIGRNEPCFCGSGIKYKKCHGK